MERKSSLSGLAQTEEVDPIPDDKATIAAKIKEAGVAEGDRVLFRIFHTASRDTELLHGVRLIVTDILDDLGMFDVEIMGQAQYIKMDDPDCYDGEVDVTVTRRHEKTDIGYK